MRRTGGEGLVVVPGENLGEVAKGTIGCEQGIGAEVGVGRKGAVVAVFSDRGPTGEERPDRAIVITRAIVDLRVPGDDAHAPICLMIFSGELRDGVVGVS